MPRPNVVVDRVRSAGRPAPEVADRRAPAGYVEVVFHNGRTARLDPADPRTPAWLSVIDTMRSAGLPAYVAVDPVTQLITELLAPVAVTVGELRDVGDAVQVELVISQARHQLRRDDPHFAELLGVLERARDSGEPVLVTETLDEHAIIDVRPLTRDLRPPPVPAVPDREPDPPAAADVSPGTAQRMFDLVNDTVCCSAAPAAPCIPFTYPDDGCWGRAHEMCRLMQASGVQPDKVWIYGNLHVVSANKPDCNVYWGWHVAPTLPVTTGSGTETFVIDPALFTGPVSRAAWAGVQGDPAASLVPTAASIFHRSVSGAVVLDPDYSQTRSVLATYRAQLQLRSTSSDGPPPYPACQVRPPGTQWIGTVAGGASGRWFTYGWPAGWHVVWTVMPTTICTGSPALRWSVAVERASSTQVTYWITVQNLTSQAVRFEGRYDVLSR